VARWFIILPDGIGRGGSSKPSDGLRARFPHYGYRDVVAAHHLVVTRALGVDHLRAVIGTSMGGMMTWMWGERWPGMMDALMPIASLPTQISGRNFLWRRMLTESIRGDPDWKDGDYTSPPQRWTTVWPVFQMMVQAPARLQAEAPTRQAAAQAYDKLVQAARSGPDTNDVLYWFESSWDYDPEPELGAVQAHLFAVNFADDQINPAELGILERLTARVPKGRFIVVPPSDRTMGHQTLTQAAVWKPYLTSLLEEAKVTVP
jgi:homoserine O-acetyltransferase